MPRRSETMRNIIYKYPIKTNRTNSMLLEFEREVKFLSVGTDRNGDACVWVLENIMEIGIDSTITPPRKATYEIIVVGTGEDVRFSSNVNFLGTVFMPPNHDLLWHVFTQKLW